ncbi:3'-5' exonuclease, partial [Neorhizobium galegae]|uniref:3'-5' exonuclease n=1 Tax=Neorhizobium galegae TaxID=399 RepID=UPI00062163AE
LNALLGGREASAVSGMEILDFLMPASRRQQFARAFPEYKGNTHLTDVAAAFVSFFDQSSSQKVDWRGCIDLLEGRGVVKLMTIHKSKGLEFHTVIFVELNDDAFWRGSDDANVFLVALSRARERIKFSFANDSKGFRNVEDFVDHLEKAGVPFVKKP